ncbi:MAG TPA: ATP-binding cassette domain-containing protein [Actinomycetota bacterium]|jgi:oleandomycin transport system ATP-binding protein
MGYAIQAEGLVKRFGETTALAGADLEARTGTVLAVLGPNGAGKTTAVRILATLLRPDGGRAAVLGHDVVAHAHQVRQLIALTGQYAAVDENLTGVENLVMIGRLLGLTRAGARARATELLAGFDVAEAGGRAAKTYSGGMRRRLDLAASLVSRPRVVYLDEPTTGLDPRGRGDLWRVVRELVGGGVTVLLTTQYMEEADQLADDVVVIDRGRVVATGTPDQLKTQVGGQVLEVSPVSADDIGTVVGVVADLTGGPPDSVNGSVSTAVSDPALPPAVLQRLTDAGVAVAGLTLRKPSLDEAFFALTGRRAGADGGGAHDDDRSAE